MPKKPFFIAVFFAVSLLFFNIKPVLSAEASPEQFVSEFYTWYISESLTNKPPIAGQMMEKFIYPFTLKRLQINRAQGIGEQDYFLQSQDLWNEWLEVMRIHPVIPLNNELCIVPVSFELDIWSDSPNFLLVFVTKENDRLYISKVENTWDY